MNASAIGKQLSSLLSRAHLSALRDDALASAGLERRRPVSRAAAAVGFAALGALGATLAVAFVPQLRRLVVGKDGVAARATALAAAATKELSHAGEVVAETARDVTGDIRELVRSDAQPAANGKRNHAATKQARSTGT